MKYLFFIFLLFFISSCDKSYHNDLLKKVIGIETTDYDILCGYDQVLTFQGEGFSMFIYSLSEDNINEFLNDKNNKNFPIKTEFRNNWYVLNWKKTPILEEDAGLFNHSTNNFSAKESECLIKMFQSNIINEPGSYYSAFYYDDNKVEPLSVDFFILNPKDRKLYFISNKT